MRDYVGVIELKHTIPCRKEVSGQTYKSKIANHDVLIIFPSIPDDYDPSKDLTFKKVIWSFLVIGLKMIFTGEQSLLGPTDYSR